MGHRHKKIKAVDPQSKRTHPSLLIDSSKFNRTPSFKELAASASAMPRSLREMLAMKDHIDKRISSQSQSTTISNQDIIKPRENQSTSIITKVPISTVKNPFAHMVALPGEKLRAFNARLRAETKRLKIQLRAEEQPIRKVSAKRKRFLDRKQGKILDTEDDNDNNNDDIDNGDGKQRKRQRSMEFASSERVGFLERADAPPVLSTKPSTSIKSSKNSSKTNHATRQKQAAQIVKGAWSPEAIQEAKNIQERQKVSSAASRARLKASEDRRAEEKREEQLALAQRDKAALESMMAYKAMKAKRQEAFEAAAKASLRSTSAQIAALKLER